MRKSSIQIFLSSSLNDTSLAVFCVEMLTGPANVLFVDTWQVFIYFFITRLFIQICPFLFLLIIIMLLLIIILFLGGVSFITFWCPSTVKLNNHKKKILNRENSPSVTEQCNKNIFEVNRKWIRSWTKRVKRKGWASWRSVFWKHWPRNPSVNDTHMFQYFA